MPYTEKSNECYIYLLEAGSDQLIIDSESMARQILPFIQRNFRDLTAHGIDHSLSVIKYINKLIEILKEFGNVLSQTEIRLLYSAAWLHDIGNLTCGERKEHSTESCVLLEKLEEKYSFMGDLKNSLEYIIKYHSSKFDISAIPPDPIYIHGDQIRLQLICSIFRLADACHIGEDRAYRLVYYLINDQIEDASKPHWVGNSSVLSIDFDTIGKRIIITVSDIEKAEILTDSFQRDFQTVLPYIQQYFPFNRVEIISERPVHFE